MDVRDYGLATDLHDGFIDLVHSYYWRVTLSNGQMVFQDDGRPGLEISSAWIRLANCLRDNPQLGITRFGVYFASNSHFLPDGQEGYYFSKGTLQGLGASSSLDYYVMGWLEGPTHNQYDPVHFQWVKVPELIPIKTYNRPIVECPFPAMILNPSGLTVPPLEL